MSEHDLRLTRGDDDVFAFVDEPSAPPPSVSAHPWQVLLVDDEPDVHAATKLALKGMALLGREIAFSHAYSAAQARELLAQRADFAVAVIDVVMENDDAGLQLVRHIRETLCNRMLRIILRTGQPGYAPEIETIQRYEINDYKTKSDLTRVRLFTSLTIAIRSYAQLLQVEAGRRGLAQILAASAELARPAGLGRFASGVVTQLCAMLGVDHCCRVCAVMQEPDRPAYVLATAGRDAHWKGLTVEAIPDPRVRRLLQDTLRSHRHSFDDGTRLFIRGTHERALAVFVDLQRPLDVLERDLFEVFVGNVSVAFENLQLYADINEMAYGDALVGLPNRNALVQAVDERRHAPGTLALVDLDGFADINSVLDDSFGDAVLQAVAQRLYGVFAPGCLVARLGGDLFGLYGPPWALTPGRIVAAFAQPFVVDDGEPLRLSASAGLVALTGAAPSGVAALKNAGAALKQAKNFQRGKVVCFEPGQADAARERMLLLNRLRASFSGEHLFLHYQPFVHLGSGRVVGAECLLRWRGSDGRFVPPGEFVPIAEQSGLMVALGDWVMQTAIAWRAGLRGRVGEDFRIAINVSHVQFVEPDFVAKFVGLLRAHELPAQQVEIELTESVAIESQALLSAKLRELRASGIRVAMDDFGTGFSSLSIIQNLPLDRLKIDRSFVSGEHADAGTFAFARMIGALAGQLGLATIAEGIETAAQCAAMVAAGCEEGQGYLFARPLTGEDFMRWLAERS